MVGLSFYGHCISDKVMSNTCYMFSPLFFFHCSSQVATNSTFTSETSFMLLLLKCLPSNGTKKLLVKIVEHKLGRFILLSVPIFQQLPRLTSLYFFSFLNRAVETWLHLSLTTFRRFWTIIYSWKLEIIPLQVTSYNAPFLQFSLESSAH